MAYVSLYRKYRSQTFSDLIGQDHVVRTLQNAITLGRIPHAFLFTGPRGTGKTSTARLLAKALCCEKGPIAEPCNSCTICASITNGSCPDVVEMDAASEAGVDEVRSNIVEAAEYQPMLCRYKVYIIDEVHDLSAKAFDALLKTIEEPPDHVVFVLATTEYNKVPATIRSRCQRHEFHRATLADLERRLRQVVEGEGAAAAPQALTAIARMADGGYRDALSLLEQAMITATGEVTLQHVYDQLGLVGEESVDRILRSANAGDAKGVLTAIDEVLHRGQDPRALLESMLYRLADLTRAVYGVDWGSSDSTREAAMTAFARELGADWLSRTRDSVSDAIRSIRDVSLPRLWLESRLLSLAKQNNVAQVEQPNVSPAEKAAPKPEPSKAVARPEPKPVQQPPKDPPTKPSATKERLVPNQPPTGDEAMDAAANLWTRVRRDLAAASELMYVKLLDTSVESVREQTMVVSFMRRVDLEWVQASAKRQGAIVERVRALGGEKWNVEFKPNENPGRREESKHDKAVELPAEGQALYQMAQKVFGSVPTDGEQA